jgi:predicted SAM-dependent methyltransferase
MSIAETIMSNFSIIYKSLKQKNKTVNPDMGDIEKSTDQCIDDKSIKINLGCGGVKFQNWINIDIEPGADIILDLKTGLPFRDSSIRYIYSEHVLEHFSHDEGLSIVKECYRVLSNGGVMRIAMPDLDHIIEKYSTDWKNQDWLSWPEYAFIKTKGQMINIAFSWWGHKYLYNEEELRQQLMDAGFSFNIRISRLESRFEIFRNLETRQDSLLIFEAVKQE